MSNRQRVEVSTIRRGKRWRIEAHFSSCPEQPQSSRKLHIEYGSGLRARIAEINADQDAAIFITNETRAVGGIEESYYVSHFRKPAQWRLPFPEQVAS